MSRFTTAGGSGTPGPQGPAGQDANTADFTFTESTMNTDGDMTIGVLGVPGEINLSAYAGVNIQTHADFGLTTNKVITTSNGATDNIKIGDDAYIGDGNVANNIVIIGQQDSLNGGIVFGERLTETISTDGSNLSLEAENDVILYPGSTYAYIDSPHMDGGNRIATWDYVDDKIASDFSETTYTVGGGSSGTQPQFNGSPLFTGSYVKTGPLVYFRVNVDMDNITNFGSGQYYVTVPFNSKYEVYIRGGHLHDTSSNKEYSISGQIQAGSNQMNLYYTASNGQEEHFTNSTPIGLSAQDDFHISGTYIIN